jgi:hypothetical protein
VIASNAEVVTAMTTIALKEWAAAVTSLERGDQIFIMRKGGIVEETRHFEVVSPSFYLLPTYEHQRRELFKPAYQSLMDDSLSAWNPEEDEIRIQSYAEVTDDIEVEDEATLEKLFPYHIWTKDFAEQRLKWKRKQPLHIILLRVYKVRPSITIRMRPEYLGCKSWVEMIDPIPRMERTPVLEEEVFRQRRDEITGTLKKI